MGRNKTKGGRILNPADAYRKAMRKREIKKVKKLFVFFFNNFEDE
jgi:hypothetical protein